MVAKLWVTLLSVLRLHIPALAPVMSSPLRKTLCPPTTMPSDGFLSTMYATALASFYSIGVYVVFTLQVGAQRGAPCTSLAWGKAQPCSL
jgi:hypothetical protein